MVNQRHETFTIFLRQDVLLLSCTALQINFVSKRVDVRANGSFLVETTHQVLEGKVAVMFDRIEQAPSTRVCTNRCRRRCRCRALAALRALRVLRALAALKLTNAPCGFVSVDFRRDQSEDGSGGDEKGRARSKHAC